MDDGRLTDSHGKTVDFTNTIIIMTSNIGAQYFKSNIDFSLKNEKNNFIKKEIMTSVKSVLRPEFINRLDEILFFSKLGKSHINKIVEIQLNYLRKRLLINNFFIEWTTEVSNLLALNGYDPEYGARPIKREIRNVIEDKISELIINNKVEDGKTLFVDVVDNKIDISVG
jgi:ATP-dependent Clp protease ATP-binding subunit ClpA